jgi:hypothetical protein
MLGSKNLLNITPNFYEHWASFEFLKFRSQNSKAMVKNKKIISQLPSQQYCHKAGR